ncbi:aldehyde dehydrogenase family protein [Chryseobacterium pennae]|uniref:Aldehyde dehydrogenase n=1 Tax=Chryseobacterium pennae TaxID=2258962 RepID=A0A3D9C9H5_9FLAO|nr:aldehyde dehydrogenase family protein [Chryseobacterium pennae]REC62236.1 aldehyde dehydrogenase family protein [Chryseobacterium pennae]
MDQAQIKNLLDNQRAFFLSGKTLEIDFRLEQLEKLRDSFIKYEPKILEAVKKDMGRNDMETYLIELNWVLDELNNTIKNLKDWAKDEHVNTPAVFTGNDSIIKPEPLGTVFILSAWNFANWQIFGPLLGAIAAGNTAVVKPSSDSPACGEVINEIVETTFSPDYVKCILGDVELVNRVLEERFDLIFFTGSPRVGKIIQAAASKNLTPTILELGGKSPAIIDETADLEHAAKSVVRTKLFNTGQICVTVDHVYVHSSIKDKFIELSKKYMVEFYGEDASQSEDYGFIINQRNYERLLGLMNTSGTLIFGGQSDASTRYISPTILDQVTEETPIMQEEIFGPIMPVLTFESIDELVALQKTKEKPLALYLFSNDKKRQDLVLAHTSAGGVTINDCMIHAASRYLPFGGVGNSGMGNYVGHASFKAFTHFKPIMIANRNKLVDDSLNYPPYAGKLEKLKRIAENVG